MHLLFGKIVKKRRTGYAPDCNRWTHRINVISLENY